MVPSHANVVVNLPADARLYADGHLTGLESATRQFQTPALEAGRDYVYTMKVETIRNGKMLVDSRRVVVRAGQETVVNFDEPTEETTLTAQK